MTTLDRHATHEVLNQPPALVDWNPFVRDLPLVAAVRRHCGSDELADLERFGARVGSAEVIDWGFLANRYPPELHTHDRFGYRADEVTYHPAYHHLMRLGISEGIHSRPWAAPDPGSHVARAARHYLLTQAEAGVLCPITMTFAAIPALAAEPSLEAEWSPRILSTVYDPRSLPATDKSGVTIGMAMTEKQGGSDVRANTTRGEPLAGSHQEFLLTGHKWFCSAPMSDAFLLLAQTDDGLTCFLAPRLRPDGSRNPMYIQRLKDKLGNRANASSEVEYRDTWARRVGPLGRGVATILEMVNHTRLDCAIGSAALMRQALAQALHHCRHRRAFGHTLAEQPLMRNVLADLALECEAATTLVMRLASAYDESDPTSAAFRRLVTAVTKYWICKRCPVVVAEALECLGGAGYVEESVLPRLYREAPLSSIWEGSGNVICLDVLRVLAKSPTAWPALVTELERARGVDRRLDRWLDELAGELEQSDTQELRARRIVERMALALQAALLVEHAPPGVADAFCATRLGREGGHQFGAMAPAVDIEALLARSWPGE
jgi:putative acyl-CoA dehydrogenase